PANLDRRFSLGMAGVSKAPLASVGSTIEEERHRMVSSGVSSVFQTSRTILGRLAVIVVIGLVVAGGTYVISISPLNAAVETALGPGGRGGGWWTSPDGCGQAGW
ncbi:MAG TPA: hypothetical protein VHS28_04345, partial [Chloroflexota bacterium]|nr:hypothetical protein [Chloroflexota bacterium]